MYNFLAKQYNEKINQSICSLVNGFINSEILSIATPIQDVPENANELYYKIDEKYYDPLDICVAIEVVELRNEIAKIKGITL